MRFDCLDFLGKKTASRVIVCLLDGKKKYEKQIATETKLSATAVSNALDGLISEKIVLFEKFAWVNLYWLNKKELDLRLKFLENKPRPERK